jgi:hypothetical protein
MAMTDSSETESRDAFIQVDPVLCRWVMDAESKHGQVEHEESETTKGKSHDSTSSEGSVEASRVSGGLGRDSGSHV